MNLTKKELTELDTEIITRTGLWDDEYALPIMNLMQVLIKEAPSSHWNNYPEVKPEKEGDYLIRSVVEPVDEVSSDLYSKDTDSWKYFDTDVIAWCEIPV